MHHPDIRNPDRLTQDADTALMLRLRDGDDTALNELMTRWQSRLASFIYRYVGNEADALDLAQETFVRVFESRRGYKPIASFSSWLFQIASNLCRNYLRWNQRHPTVPLDAAAHESGSLGDALSCAAESPFEAMAHRELAAAVRQGVHSLPHDLKTALLLFEYEELSHDEIAAVLGCTRKAVETRLYRARNLLRDRFAQLRNH